MLNKGSIIAFLSLFATAAGGVLLSHVGADTDMSTVPSGTWFIAVVTGLIAGFGGSVAKNARGVK